MLSISHRRTATIENLEGQCSSRQSPQCERGYTCGLFQAQCFNSQCVARQTSSPFFIQYSTLPQPRYFPCESDMDCALVPIDCCGSCSGALFGRMFSIHKGAEGSYINDLQAYCSDQRNIKNLDFEECGSRYNCYENWVPSCRDGICDIVSTLPLCCGPGSNQETSPDDGIGSGTR